MSTTEREHMLPHKQQPTKISVLEGYVSMDDVVNELGVTRRAILRYMHQGRLRAARLGRKWFVQRESLMHVMQENATGVADNEAK